VNLSSLELLEVVQRSAVLVSYILIGVELLLLPIPSEVSGVHLISNKAGPDRTQARGGANARSRSQGGGGRFRRLKYLFVPAVELGLSCLAFVWALHPGVREFLLPVGPAPGPLLRAASVSLVAGGSVLGLAAVLQLRGARRRCDRGNSRDCLYTRGLYSLSRNPIQLGTHLACLGWTVALASWVMIGGLLFYLYHKHRRILLEERHLDRLHGSRYRRYRRAVGRYLRNPLR
jgi:protein-S-isoprenylcysteine O-methyltransferase Ste14